MALASHSLVRLHALCIFSVAIVCVCFPKWDIGQLIPFAIEILNQGDKMRVVQTLLFVGGINTLLQTLFGTRLPTVIGGSWAFMVPIISIIHDPSLERIPDPHMVCFVSWNISSHWIVGSHFLELKFCFRARYNLMGLYDSFPLVYIKKNNLKSSLLVFLIHLNYLEWVKESAQHFSPIIKYLVPL